MKKKYVFIVTCILCLCNLAAEEPAHRFSFSEYYSDHPSYWLSNHEAVIEGWYFNRNTNLFIPPYLGTFMEVSPYDHKTGFYYSDQYIYLSTIEDYAKGIPPRAIQKPAHIPPLDRSAAWISDTEILFLSYKYEEAWGSFESYTYIIYSVIDDEWKEIEDDWPFYHHGIIWNMYSSTDNYFLIAEHQPEIPFSVYSLIKYIPETKSFESSVYDQYSEMGDRGGVTGSGIHYNVSITQEGRVLYTGIIGRTCLIMDPQIFNEFTGSIVFPEYPDTRGFRNSQLSPNELSLMVEEIKEPKIGPQGRETPVSEILIFDERIQQSYHWKIRANEMLGTDSIPFNDGVPYNIENVIDYLFYPFPELENDRNRERIRRWLLFLNRHNKRTNEGLWIIPYRGSFLYMLGLGNNTFTVEVETLK